MGGAQEDREDGVGWRYMYDYVRGTNHRIHQVKKHKGTYNVVVLMEVTA